MRALHDVLGIARREERPAEQPATPERAAAVGPLVLVAEDNEVNRRVALAMLERSGCRVETVVNGREALEAVTSRHYDLVLMDVQMPEMDGLTATAAIRAREDETGRRTPIVAMTAHAMNEDRERCLAAGMDDYISKPVKSDELRAKLARWTSAGATAPSEQPAA
jgi:CheY-like chemotaxis protein